MLHNRLLSVALGILLVVLLAACGATQQTAAPGPTTAPPPLPTVVPASATPIPAATAIPAATSAAEMPTDAGHMQETDHGAAMGDSTTPYDAKFIDSMIEHHQGAIDMAKQALTEAEHTELKTLAQTIITAQEAEITQMQQWRASWYPDLAATSGMGMDMGDMEISDDTGKPFDQRFIEAMIAHHQGAIEMAKDAREQAEHQEIKTLAQNIVAAQESEITQMQQWLKAWYNQ